LAIEEDSVRGNLKFLMLAAAFFGTACVTVAPAATNAPPSVPVATSTGRPPTSAPSVPQQTATATASPSPTPTLNPTVGPNTAPPASTAVGTPGTSPGSDEGSVGEKIRLADYQYVTMADAEWSETGYDDFFEPAEGNVVYAFQMDFEGIAPTGSSYNPLSFKLIANNTEYTYALLTGKEPALTSGELAPGATASGWLSFEAPLVDTVLLRYEPVFGANGDSVEWTVTVNQ
jgi:hypothetical protein